MKYACLLLALGSLAWSETLWDSHFSQGEVFQRSGNYTEAAREFQAALDWIRQNDPEDVRVPVTCNNLGVVYRELGRPYDAERYYRLAVANYEKRSGFEIPLATALNNLAALDVTTGHVSRARDLYRRSLALHVDTQTLQGLARVAQESHRPAEAEGFYRQALALGESAPVLHNYATLLDETRRFDEAEGFYDRALAIYRGAVSANPDAAIVLRHLAELHARKGLTEQANSEFREALAICLPNHPETAVIFQAYARFLDRTRHGREAAVWNDRARAMASREPSVIDILTLR